jgi:hypothetical protein
MTRLLAAASLVACALVLGATAFQEQVASAAQGIMQVRVVNSAEEPVPVREQAPIGQKTMTESHGFGEVGLCQENVVNASTIVLSAPGNAPTEFTVGEQVDCNPPLGPVRMRIVVPANEIVSIVLPERLRVNTVLIRCPEGPCGSSFYALGS